MKVTDLDSKFYITDRKFAVLTFEIAPLYETCAASFQFRTNKPPNKQNGNHAYM